jgi:hypothetical protein
MRRIAMFIGCCAISAVLGLPAPAAATQARVSPGPGQSVCRPQAPEMSKTPNTPRVPQAPAGPEVPGMPQAPEVPRTPHLPKAPDGSDKPETCPAI